MKKNIFFGIVHKKTKIVRKHQKQQRRKTWRGALQQRGAPSSPTRGHQTKKIQDNHHHTKKEPYRYDKTKKNTPSTRTPHALHNYLPVSLQNLRGNFVARLHETVPKVPHVTAVVPSNHLHLRRTSARQGGHRDLFMNIIIKTAVAKPNTERPKIQHPRTAHQPGPKITSRLQQYTHTKEPDHHT